MSTPRRRRPVIIVHDRCHAEGALRAAKEADIPVTLWSAPGAGDYAGLGFLGTVFDQAAAAVPGARYDVVIDCAASGALAHEAIRRGFGRVAFSGRGRMRKTLEDIAAAEGGRLITSRPSRQALDLGYSDTPELDCAAYLAAQSRRGS